MSKIKIKNGFLNLDGNGNILTADLLEGTIEIGDKIIIGEIKIPIIEVKTLSGLTSNTMALTIPRSYEHTVIWHTKYGKDFEIENTQEKDQ